MSMLNVQSESIKLVRKFQNIREKHSYRYKLLINLSNSGYMYRVDLNIHNQFLLLKNPKIFNEKLKMFSE